MNVYCHIHKLRTIQNEPFNYNAIYNIAMKRINLYKQQYDFIP